MNIYIRSLALCMIMLMLGFGTLMSQEVVFDTIPTTVIVPAQITGNQGHAWGDVNGDGILDLFLPSNAIMLDSITTFTQLTTANMTGSANSVGSAFADFNADGLNDLLRTDGGPYPHLFMDSAKLAFVDTSAFMGALTATGNALNNFGSATIFDYDRDGYLDVAFPGNPGIWLLKGSSSGFTQVGKTSVTPAIDTTYLFECWNSMSLDANSDGYIDLLVPSFRNSFARIDTGSAAGRKGTVLFVNDQAGNLIVPTEASLGRPIFSIGSGGPQTTPDTGIIVNDTVRHFEAITNTVGDFNNDGIIDIFLNSNSANNYCSDGVFRNNILLYGKGDGTFEWSPGDTAILCEGSMRAVSAGDYNNDGNLDLVTGGSGGTQTRVWRNNGDGSFTDVTAADNVYNVTAAGGYRGLGLVDYNNDGFVDIFGHYGGANPTTRLWKNGGNSNHWIGVKPVGTGNNLSAIGARIVVQAGGMTLTRMISSDAGCNGTGGALYATIGIGASTSVDQMDVIWPDGETQTFTGLGIDQYWVVKEGSEIPAAPVLVSPASGATGQTTSLSLNWNAVSGTPGNPVTYQVQLSLDPTFETNVIFNDSLLDAVTRPVVGLGNSSWYHWRVRALEAGFYGAWSADSFQTIMQAPLPPIPLISPVSNAVDQPALITLVASKSIGAAQYHWQVSTDPNFGSFAVNDSTTDSTRVVGPLISGTKYYWQVSGVNPGGESTPAGPDSFTVMTAPGVPVLAFPASNQESMPADTLNLSWSSVATASGYECQISLNSAFSSLVFVRDSSTTTTYMALGLQNITKYYWRVRGINIGGSGAFTAIDSFTTIVPIPAAPVLSSPASGATGIARCPTFVWRASRYATNYRLQVSTNSAFTGIVADLYTTNTDTTITLLLEDTLNTSTLHYWHVSAIDTNGASAYSASRIFTTTSDPNYLDVDENNPGVIPVVYALLQNYPNPFNPSTIISYDIPAVSHVDLTIYDVLGRQVAKLVNGVQAANRYSITWNSSHLGSGIYFYRIHAKSLNGSAEFTSVKKLVFIK